MFATGTAPLVCSGCHFVDLLRWFVGDEVEEVYALANHEAFPEYPESDLSVLLMRFRSGVIGKVVTAFAAGRPQDHSVRIYGSERSVENSLLFAPDGSFEVIARPFLRHRRSAGRGPVRALKDLWRDVRENLKSVAFAKVFAGLLRLHGRSQNYAVAGFPLRVYEHAYAVRSCLEDCLECIRTGRRAESTALDAAKTVATCLAGVESYRTGRPVRMEQYQIPEFADAEEPRAAPAQESGAGRSSAPEPRR
jgi:predicted dehydrogenase